MNYSILEDFEKLISEYTGAPYVVLTDSCTHAIELCLRYQKWQGPIIMPCHTYISVPMTMHKLGLEIYWDKEYKWDYEYRISPTNIWDSARAFDKDMHKPGTWKCVSFGWDKRLAIGHGGAILLDKRTDYISLRSMAYDGRHLHNSPWQKQTTWYLGFHYNMRLEDAARGIELLSRPDEMPNMKSQIVTYPDVSKISINID